MIDQNFIKIYENSFRVNWDKPALTDYKDQNSLTYAQLAEEIARLHLFFDELGIEKGDKVALIGKNHSTWSLVFLATFTYGAVIVPILHEFNTESMIHIINHSDSKCAFINDNIWSSIDKKRVSIPTFMTPQTANTPTNNLRAFQNLRTRSRSKTSKSSTRAPAKQRYIIRNQILLTPAVLAL